MRNAKVFIILIGQNGVQPQGEEGQCAMGLYRKYNGRSVDGVVQQVELIACTDAKGKGTKHATFNGTLNGPGTPITLVDGDRVGIYLVGHYQDYREHKPAEIIEQVLEEHLDAAPKVQETVDGKQRNRRIRVTLDKVCLVLCEVARRTVKKSTEVRTADQPIVVREVDEKEKAYKKRVDADAKKFGAETSFLVDMCRNLADRGYRPRIAGYVGMITVAGPMDETNGYVTRYRDVENNQLQLRVGQKTNNGDRDAAKLCFVYQPGKGYVQRDVAEWTDRPMV